MTVEANNKLAQEESFITKLQRMHWTRLLIFFTLGALFVAWIFRILTPEQLPPQPIVQTNYDQTTTSFSGVTYTGEPISVPSTFPTGIGAQKTIDATELAEKIAKHLDLDQVESKNPRIKVQYENTQYRLTFQEESNSFELMSKSEVPSTSVSNTGAITKIAQDIVDLVYGTGALAPIQSGIEFLAVEGAHFEEVKSSDATAVMIPFGAQLGVYPVYLEQQLYHPATVWVNGNDQIQKAFFYLEYPSYETKNSYRSLTYTQALANINQGNASIITSSYEEAAFPSLSSITSGNLRSGKIEYRLDPTSETLIPYYQFVGSLTNAQGQTVEATIITPAVQTNFSNQ